MANLTLWDPISEVASFRNAFDRLFDQSWGRPLQTASTGPYAFALELSEHGDEYRVSAALPGIKSEEVDINVQGNTLTIKAQRNVDERSKDGTWYVRELAYGQFYRQMTLPTGVQADAVEAHLENGILHLRLPKVASARAHRIPVNGHEMTKAKVIEPAS